MTYTINIPVRFSGYTVQNSLIYMVYLGYTWHIQSISYSNFLDIQCKILWYTSKYIIYIKVYLMYILRIYIVYHKDIIIKKGTEQTHEVWSRYIPGILVTWAYDWNIPGIPGIYLVYTMHIPKSFWYSSYITWIFMEYTIRYILCIYLNIPCLYIVYAQYIHCIYLVYI